jgi:hypothetical protein
VTGVYGDHPIGLRVLLKAVAVSERPIPLHREPFPAAREDEYFVEHGVVANVALVLPVRHLTHSTLSVLGAQLLDLRRGRFWLSDQSALGN